MPTNPYVRWWDDSNEQDLLQSLMTEAIRMYGIDIIYLPRTMRREDTLYNEDILSQFTKTYAMEVYLKNVNGWEGQGDFLSKFGLKIQDRLDVMLSRERFLELIPTQDRPQEGDLIYLPRPMHALFEIKWVKHEKSPGQFYPLGRLTFYELQLELFNYDQQQIQTGDEDIDIFERNEAYAQDLVFALGGSGTYSTGETVYQGSSVATATATGVVASWDASTRTARVTTITGQFAEDYPVIGATSGASYVLATDPDLLENPNDPTNDNRYLDDADDDVIDTRERDRQTRF